MDATKPALNSPIIRASGIYDALILLPFAIPGVSAWALKQMGVVNDLLSLPGSVPDFSPFALLFVNMMATLAILYAMLRIREPNRRYGGYDIVARILMAALILIYLLAHNIAGIMWAFFAVETLWAVLQIWAISRK